MNPPPHPTPASVTVFYHADCLDGFGAAYAAWRRFGDAARYRPMHHGNPWTKEDVDGRELYVLDFSFPPDELLAMAALARSTTLIDHHASACEAWERRLGPAPGEARTHWHLPDARLRLDFDLGKSGARLAWEHFQPDLPVPAATLHIEDQDMWRFSIDGTRAFCRALRMRPFEFAEWDTVFQLGPDSPAHRAFLAEGAAVERFLAIEVARLAASDSVMAVMLPAPEGGVPGLAINANALFTSDLGGQLAARSGTFGLVWHRAADGEVKASLRGCNTVNVAHLAARFGGGGHPNAAGFRMSADRFTSEILGSCTHTTP